MASAYRPRSPYRPRSNGRCSMKTTMTCLRYMDTFCTMALAASFHSRSRIFEKGAPVETQRPAIEFFATRELAHSLLVGTAHDPERAAPGFCARRGFSRPARRSRQRSAMAACPSGALPASFYDPSRKSSAFYDATITGVDPFPGPRKSAKARTRPSPASIAFLQAASINCCGPRSASRRSGATSF